MDKIDLEKLFKFFNEATKNDLIFEQTRIKNFLNEKQIPIKQTEKKNLQITKAIVKIPIKKKSLKKTYLVFEDYPLSFLLSVGILINEDEKFSEAEHRFDEATLIFPTSIKDKVEEDILENSTKKIDVKEIIGKEIELEYEQPKIIQHIKEYLKIHKNINPNIIEKAKIKTPIENFTPSLKQTHFNHAKNEEVPIIPLIKNDFIIESSINIFDINKQIEILKPMRTYDEREEVIIEKKSQKRVYQDVSTTYFLKVEPEDIIRKIEMCEISNISKNKLIKRVKNITKIEISQNQGEYPIPIWKVHENQNFIEVQGLEHIEEITGINFDYDLESLKNLYIQDKYGEKGIYKNQYIKERYIKTFQTLPDDNNIIVYRKPTDLIIKSIMCDKISIIIKQERISEEQEIKLKNIISSLIERTIIETIKFNKKPEEKQAETFSEKYFESLTNDLNFDLLNFLKIPSKTKLIHKTIHNIKILHRYLNKNKVEKEEIYFLVNVILKALKILKLFDEQGYIELKNRFTQYFEIKKIRFKEIPKEKNKINKLVKQIVLANIQNKKYKTLIFEKKSFPKELLSPDSTIIQDEPKFKIRIREDSYKIKKYFPYRHREIIEQIKKIDFDKNNKNIMLTLGSKKIPLKKDYCKIIKIYDKYKVICENEYFTLLKQN